MRVLGTQVKGGAVLYRAPVPEIQRTKAEGETAERPSPIGPGEQ